MISWERLNEWLRDVPVDDPVDRRNAPMLQLVLAVPGVLLPLMSAIALVQTGTFGTSQATGVALSGVLWLCFGLLRQGRFRLAASFAVAVSLVMMGLNYQAYGLKAQLGLQVTHLLPLLFAGLLLGRHAIWRTLSVIGAILALGAWVDLDRATDALAARQEVVSDLLSAGLGFIVVATILDRLVSASRRAIRRSEELDLICDDLEREIDEKERSQAQLLQSQRIEVLGRLAGGIAHDFNNLLGVIAGHAGRARTTADPQTSARALEGIAHATRRGTLMVRRLLGLGRSVERRIEVFDAAEAIRATSDLLRPLFDVGVAIRLQLPDQPLRVRLDREEFELALLNVATNARDAMPGGGTFEIRALRHDDQVRIVLSDTGVGMSAAVAARMFEPFFTTKPDDKGTGIGMAVVHRLIDEAGGRIGVDSAPGRGTVLTIELPAAAAAAPRASGEGPMQVLLVEDDVAARIVLAEALEAAGLDVTAVGAVEPALAQAGARRFAAVVSDYQLPDGDGLSLLRRLHALQPAQRQILVSGRSDLPSVDPPVCVLRKPFTPDDLLDRLFEAEAGNPLSGPADRTGPTPGGAAASGAHAA
ncbi:MAG TPA: ATP-binding protein [Dokdonella sp.]|uniref:ATP-binding protein n=1 Tax=Dokdonella sp. TaxID=2291710 RepID=UPI002C7070B0|nr:ATP-binding protein [Dokdonella sp.]HUD41678.1 ATP-binding protein [Dokdonella sp.]